MPHCPTCHRTMTRKMAAHLGLGRPPAPPPPKRTFNERSEIRRQLRFREAAREDERQHRERILNEE